MGIDSNTFVYWWTYMYMTVRIKQNLYDMYIYIYVKGWTGITLSELINTEVYDNEEVKTLLYSAPLFTSVKNVTRCEKKVLRIENLG